MLGHWRNVEELEESLTLEELVWTVEAARKRDERQNKFLAALKGINLDDDGEETLTAEEKVEEMKRKAAGRAKGMSDDEIEFEDLGLDIEVEE